MFRQLMVFIVLLVHINGSMFLPQVAEQDIYNTQGQQQKDINTIFEWVDEQVMDHHEKNPVDQDNDQGQNFHLVKVVDYYFAIPYTSVKHHQPNGDIIQTFCFHSAEKIHSVVLDIAAPPPKV